jgi:hypothetical protein
MAYTLNNRPWVPDAAVTPTGLVMSAGHLARLPNLRQYQLAAQVTTAAIVRMMRGAA